MNRFRQSMLTIAIVLFAEPLKADLITFSPSPPFLIPTRQVTAMESGGTAPGNGGTAPAFGDVYQFRVTTDADIVSINQIAIRDFSGVPLTVLYNNTFGDASNAEPGNPALAVIAPGIGVDTYITTPGTTSRLGQDLPGDGQTTFGDLTNNGAQDNFLFAQLTVPNGTRFRFSGRISIASTVNPGESFVQPFLFGIPEPASSSIAGMALIGMVAASRRSKCVIGLRAVGRPSAINRLTTDSYQGYKPDDQEDFAAGACVCAASTCYPRERR